MPNVAMKKLPLSSWRLLALGSWRAPRSPNVYAALEFDATRILDRQKRAGASRPTLTAIIAKAVAETLRLHPQINGLIRWGSIYQRKHVNLFLQTAVDDQGKELSGVLIESAEEKTLSQIMQELASKSAAIRQGRDPNFKKAKSTFGKVPSFVIGPVLDLMGFLLYTLNLDLRWLGIPKDPFGSVMITSIGSIGLDEAFGPLVAYSRVPFLIAIGAIADRPIVKQGQIAIAPIFKMCVTFDHRFMDGVHAAKMVKTVRRLLETDEGLDELGLN